jgi:hypothetical protein
MIGVVRESPLRHAGWIAIGLSGMVVTSVPAVEAAVEAAWVEWPL